MSFLFRLSLIFLVGLSLLTPGLALAWPANPDLLAGQARTGSTQALEELTELAEDGDAVAQYNLALLLLDDQGPQPYRERGVEWLRKAAEGGHIGAQYRLGQIYEPTDPSRAAAWYRVAADQGHLAAQVQLAKMYWEGRGVRHDYEAVLRLLRSAAGAGLPEAQYRVGWMLEWGLGTDREIEEAVLFYGQAAESGHQLARQRLEALADAVAEEP